MKIIIKVFSLLVLAVLLLTNINAQPSITWQKLYNSSYDGYESGHAICQTSDGNFILAGLIYIGSIEQAIVLKIDPYGDTLWLRIIENTIIRGAYCCAATDDGGCVITGDGTANFAVRLNSNGTFRWTRFYGGNGALNYDIKVVAGGGYIFCGRNGYVTKIDASGDLLWEKSFSSGSLKSILNCIDSGFIVSGTVWDTQSDTGKALIIKINNDGLIQWEKRYVIQNQGASILESDVLDNEYLFGGTATDTIKKSQGSSFIAKTDINGNLTFSKIFYTNKQEYFYDIKKINENRYVMAVRQTFIPASLEDNAKLYITDSLGNIIYQKVFPNNFFNAFRSVLPLSNGDITAAGIYEFGFLYGQRDIYVARIDSMLNSPPLSITTNSTLISNVFKLYQNYPNPFNPSTTISFSLKKNSFVKLKVFEITGKEIKVLLNEYKHAGSYSITFGGTDIPSGVYFYQMETDDFSEVRKMVVLK